MRADKSGDVAEGRFSAGLIILLLTILLFVPYALLVETSINNLYPEYNRTTYSVVAASWVLSYSYGADIAGPFVRTGLSLPDFSQLLLSVLPVLVSLYLFHSVRGLAITRQSRLFIKSVVIASLFLLLAITGGASGLLLNGVTIRWTGIPFPALQILGVLAVYFWYRHSYTEADAG